MKIEIDLEKTGEVFHLKTKCVNEGGLDVKLFTTDRLDDVTRLIALTVEDANGQLRESD